MAVSASGENHFEPRGCEWRLADGRKWCGQNSNRRVFYESEHIHLFQFVITKITNWRIFYKIMWNFPNIYRFFFVHCRIVYVAFSRERSRVNQQSSHAYSDVKISGVENDYLMFESWKKLWNTVNFAVFSKKSNFYLNKSEIKNRRIICCPLILSFNFLVKVN